MMGKRNVTLLYFCVTFSGVFERCLSAKCYMVINKGYTRLCSGSIECFTTIGRRRAAEAKRSGCRGSFIGYC